MESRATNIKQVIHDAQIPNGEYNGTWGGYLVKVTVGEKNYEIRTKKGIRTMNAPCIVKVKDGIITISTKS